MLTSECHAASGVIFIYRMHTTSPEENYLDSAYGICLCKITFHAVLTQYLARVGIMGMVGTVWYATFSNLSMLSAQLTIASARLCTALVRSQVALQISIMTRE
jgi:hypothetical protein